MSVILRFCDVNFGDCMIRWLCDSLVLSFGGCEFRWLLISVIVSFGRW